MTRPTLHSRLPILLASALVFQLPLGAMAGGAEPTPGAALGPEQPTTPQEEVPALDTTKVWPCVQRKVETVSVGQVWDGPSIEGIKGWYTNKELVDLIDVLASRRVPVAEAQEAIKTYADAQPADQRDKNLTTLFAALFDKISTQRRTVMAGIEKYQKSQIERSKELERQSTAIGKLEKELPAKSSSSPGEIIPDTGNIASGNPELDKAREHFNWAQRIFQERQSSMPLACELPGIIDERLYALAQSIRQAMSN
jgi:hypothetical protein